MVAMAPTLEEAREKAYQGVKRFIGTEHSIVQILR